MGALFALILIYVVVMLFRAWKSKVPKARTKPQSAKSRARLQEYRRKRAMIRGFMRGMRRR